MDKNERLTVAQWLEQSRICKREGLPHLVPICLDNAAARAAEGDRTLAEILEEIVWTP